MIFYFVIIILIVMVIVTFFLTRSVKADNKDFIEMTNQETLYIQNLTYLRKEMKIEDDQNLMYMLTEAVVQLDKKVKDLERTYKRDH